MSLFNRRLFLLAPLALVACGFAPIYGPDGTGTRLQNRVLVAEPENREGYLLVRQIEQKIGRTTAPDFGLSLSLDLETKGLGITSTGATSRYNIVGVARFSLVDQRNGTEVLSGDVQNFTGYSGTGNTVETLASQRDAEERLMVILADQIVARLLSADLPE